MPPGQNADDLHFDADENWTLKSYTGVKLLQTAFHELGHSLGSHPMGVTSII